MSAAKPKKLPSPLGFIGCGHMAQAIIHGLLARRLIRPQDIFVTGRDAKKLKKQSRELGVKALASNRELLARCKHVILAVKPQHISDVAVELHGSFTPKHLLITVAAGTTIERLRTLFGPVKRVVRAMPNMAARTGFGMTALYRCPKTPATDLVLTKRMFEAVGTVAVLTDERLMEAVTGLSGSGPAYVFLFVEAMIDAGVDLGLDPETAYQLAVQTVMGAAHLLADRHADPKELRRRVASPGGTTLEGLKALEEGLFPQTVKSAVAAAARRAHELTVTAAV